MNSKVECLTSAMLCKSCYFILAGTCEVDLTLTSFHRERAKRCVRQDHTASMWPDPKSGQVKGKAGS